MFIHVCPLTGHKRKFASGRAAKRWLAEQAAKYVPTLAEDIKASRETTLGVGVTRETIKKQGKRKAFSQIPRDYRHDTVSDIYDIHGWQPRNLSDGVRREKRLV